MSVLGVVTKASSHPVGSKSCALKPPDSNGVLLLPAHVLHDHKSFLYKTYKQHK